MEGRAKRNLVTRNAFHTCLCLPLLIRNGQDKEGEPCQERDKSQICHPHAFTPAGPAEEECVKRAIVPLNWNRPPVMRVPVLAVASVSSKRWRSGRRTLVPLQLNDSAARGVHELTQRGSAAPGALNQLPGDELAALMIAAIGQLRAYLFKHDVHIRLRAFAEFDHAPLRRQDAVDYGGIS